jgi:hypothetical protein
MCEQAIIMSFLGKGFATRAEGNDKKSENVNLIWQTPKNQETKSVFLFWLLARNGGVH